MNPTETGRLDPRQQAVKVPTETTAAGLIVPAGTVDKADKTLLLEDMKVVFWAMRFLSEQGLGMVTICVKCERPASPAKTEGVLECACARWVIR